MAIEIKTLVQNLSGEDWVTTEWDTDLAQHLNDGWKIVPELSGLLTYPGANDFGDIGTSRIVTLKRETKEAKTLLEQEEEAPWMPGLTQNEAYELYMLAGGKKPDYSSTTSSIRRAYDSLIEKELACIEHENALTRRIPRVKITGAGIAVVNSRRIPGVDA